MRGCLIFLALHGRTLALKVNEMLAGTRVTALSGKQPGFGKREPEPEEADPTLQGGNKTGSYRVTDQTCGFMDIETFHDLRTVSFYCFNTEV